MIHEDNNEWIFKFKEEEKDLKVPFIWHGDRYSFEDGQDIECILETLAGIERAKPLW